MLSTQEPPGIDPAARYAALGEFDFNSYEEDLERFPEFFDSNGWPKFGNFDPYALEHPITKQPWCESPRVPAANETDTEYGAWYRLAEEFRSAIFPEFRRAAIAKWKNAGRPLLFGRRIVVPLA